MEELVLLAPPLIYNKVIYGKNMAMVWQEG